MSCVFYFSCFLTFNDADNEHVAKPEGGVPFI